MNMKKQRSCAYRHCINYAPRTTRFCTSDCAELEDIEQATDKQIKKGQVIVKVSMTRDYDGDARRKYRSFSLGKYVNATHISTLFEVAGVKERHQRKYRITIEPL